MEKTRSLENQVLSIKLFFSGCSMVETSTTHSTEFWLDLSMLFLLACFRFETNFL